MTLQSSPATHPFLPSYLTFSSVLFNWASFFAIPLETVFIRSLVIFMLPNTVAICYPNWPFRSIHCNWPISSWTLLISQSSFSPRGVPFADTSFSTGTLKFTEHQGSVLGLLIFIYTLLDDLTQCHVLNTLLMPMTLNPRTLLWTSDLCIKLPPWYFHIYMIFLLI